jgi:hypothetical protein
MLTWPSGRFAVDGAARAAAAGSAVRSAGSAAPADVLGGGVVAVGADAHDASASSVHIRQIAMG